MHKLNLLTLLLLPVTVMAGAPGDQFLGDGIPYNDAYLTAPPTVTSKQQVTIDVAADKLVPRGDQWQITITEDAANTPVRWANESQMWDKQLQTMAQNSGLEATVDPSTKRVHIAKSKSRAAAHQDALNKHLAQRKKEQAGGADKPVDQIPTAPIEYSVLPSDETLSRSVRRWAQTAGWTIDWQAKQTDYEISSRADFDGEFRHALSELFIALSRTGSSLGISFATNRHVIVHTVQ